MHWGFVLLFAYGVLNKWMSAELSDPSLFRLEIFFAGIFMLLLFGRFVYMTKHSEAHCPKIRVTSKNCSKCTPWNVYKPRVHCINRTGNRRTLLDWAKRRVNYGSCDNIHEFSVGPYWLVVSTSSPYFITLQS